MAYTLGIDIGSSAVKGVLVEEKGRSPQVVGVFQRQREANALPDIAGVYLDALKVVDGEVLRTIVSLSGTELATHHIRLPFIDRKQISLAIPSEVEAQVPFELDQSSLTSRAVLFDDRGSLSIASVVHAELIEASLAQLKQAGVDPEGLLHPADAISRVSSNITRATLIIDLGAQRSLLAAVLPGGMPIHLRVVGFGIDDLLVAASAHLDVHQNDAMDYILNTAFDKSIMRDASMGSSAGLVIEQELRPIIREAKLVLASAEGAARAPFQDLMIVGGGAHCRGLASHLASQLSMTPVEHVLPNGIPSSRFALAFALTRSALKGDKLDFRIGSFARRLDTEVASRRMLSGAMYFVVCWLLLLVGNYVRTQNVRTEESRLEGILCETTKKATGTCEKDFGKALSLLRGQGITADELPQMSAVGMLSELTASARQVSDLRITKLELTPSKETIYCAGKTSQAIERFEEELKKKHCIEKIGEGKQEKSKDGSQVTVTLDVRLDCKKEGV